MTSPIRTESGTGVAATAPTIPSQARIAYDPPNKAGERVAATAPTQTALGNKLPVSEIANLVNQYVNDPYGLYLATKQYGLTQQDISSALGQTPEQAANLAKGFANADLVNKTTGATGSQFNTLYNQLQSGQITPQNFTSKYSAGSSANTTATPSFSFNFGNPSVGTTSTASGLDTSNPYVQAAEKTVAGNIAGAQAATAANRVNQFTPYGNLTYQQTGVDAQGNPVWSATQSLAPQLQGAFGNIAGQVTQGTAQGFNPNLPSVGINPGETYEAAIMRRLQPQQERQSKALEAQLANQGIMPGSEAYNRAKTDLAQAQNDQLTSAVVGGFQTGLAANQSAYNQALSNYQLPLATMNQFKAATAPSYVNPYNQAAVSGPDYLGAYTTSQNAELAANAANAARQSAITGGLFNLAGTALANPTAVGNLINLGGQALGAIGSGLNSATNWLGNATGNPLTALNYGTNLGSQQTQMLANQDSWF